jgi:hypothetical protein
MTAEAEALLRRAPRVSRRQLDSARGRLGGLNPGEWRAVEELGQRLAEAIAIELIDQAERDGRLAAALAAMSDRREAD